jgi:hypothetical protein
MIGGFPWLDFNKTGNYWLRQKKAHVCPTPDSIYIQYDIGPDFERHTNCQPDQVEVAASKSLSRDKTVARIVQSFGNAGAGAPHQSVAIVTSTFLEFATV